jgi:hypothetical protein
MLLISIGLRLAAPSAGASNLLFLLPCQVLASLFLLVWARPLLLLSIAPSETFAVAAAWHAYNAMCRPNVSHLLTYRVTSYSAVRRGRKCAIIRGVPPLPPLCRTVVHLFFRCTFLCQSCPARPPGGMLVGYPASGRRSMACV